MNKYLTCLVLLLVISCSEDKKTTQNVSKNETELSINMDDKLSDIVLNYLKMKNAFVKDNEVEASEHSKAMIQAFNDFSIKELGAEVAHKFSEIKENSNKHLEQISTSNLKQQREHFVSVSSDLYNLVKLVGTEIKLFKEYCSMYKPSGGMWLSSSNKIRNPYYGSKMLKCGKVQEKI